LRPWTVHNVLKCSKYNFYLFIFYWKAPLWKLNFYFVIEKLSDSGGGLFSVSTL